MRRPVSEENYLQFHSEQLESRQLLAGNVNVVARHGDVTVTGDHSANDILIYDAPGDTIYVVGRNATSINGGSFAQVTLLDDLKINLKHGNNRIELGLDLGTFLHVNDDLIIRTGHGSDSLVTNNLFVGDDLRVSLGGGTNSVTDGFAGFNYYTVGDDARITSGGQLGVDIDWTVVGDLSISSGHQDDSIIFRGSVFDDLSISSRGGNDYVGIGNGHIYDDLRISTSGGDDYVVFSDSTVGDNFRVSMSHGFDTAYIVGVFAQMSGVEVLL
jgi:hypothetical protein